MALLFTNYFFEIFKQRPKDHCRLSPTQHVSLTLTKSDTPTLHHTPSKKDIVPLRIPVVRATIFVPMRSVPENLDHPSNSDFSSAKHRGNIIHRKISELHDKSWSIDCNGGKRDKEVDKLKKARLYRCSQEGSRLVGASDTVSVGSSG